MENVTAAIRTNSSLVCVYVCGNVDVNANVRPMKNLTFYVDADIKLGPDVDIDVDVSSRNSPDRYS